MPVPALKTRVSLLLVRLAEAYPDSTTALHFETPFQLLIATILSAQCTDERVNMVTPALFERFPTPKAFANADIADIEKMIQSTGFFRNKAKNIQGAAKAIVENHGGEVPNTQDELVALPGVGRKTANCVLGSAFGIPGITVDTHVGRLSRRLGLTKHTDPVKAELELNDLIPQSEWTRFSHRLIDHGRAVCDARKPDCESCCLKDICPKVGVD